MVPIMLCNIKFASFTLAKVNEDALGAAENCAWVLDGSTGLNGKRLVADESGTDAQWHAAAFSDFLREQLPTSPLSLPELFSLGVRTVWEEFCRRAGGAVERGDTPCTLGTAVRLRGGWLEYINIGDCLLLLRRKDGSVEELSDTTLSGMDQNTLSIALDIARRENKSIAECRPLFLSELRRVRMTMNTPQGYISLADDDQPVLRAKCGRVRADEIRDICLLSDGFSQYFKLFTLAENSAQFLERVAANDPADLYRELTDAQRADPLLWNYPRFKLSDDATLLYAAIDTEKL